MRQEAESARYQALIEQGHDLAWAGEWMEASELYRQALEIQPDALLYIDLGLALYESDALIQALEAYQNALSLTPDEPAALQKVAEIHARLGKGLAAASSYMLLADSYMRARQPSQAVAAWQQAVRHDPMNRAAYRRLADAYRRGRREDLASQAVLALARLHLEAGEEAEALALAEEAVGLQPDFTAAHQLLSRLRGEAPTPPPPSRPVRDPMDFAPFDEVERSGEGTSPTEAAQQRALARLAEAFFDEAGVDLTIEAMKARAIDLQTRGLVEEASRTYEEIVEAGGGSGAVYYTLGTLYQTMLRFDDAARTFQEVVDHPDYAMAARFATGQCYQSQGRIDEALHFFQEALKVADMEQVEREQADEIIQLYEGLADSYEAKGDLKKAEYFRKILADFLTERGWDDKLLALASTWDGPRPMLADEPLLDPYTSDRIRRAMELSQSYADRGAFRAALDELYFALPAAPTYLPLHRRVAALFQEAGQPEDAVEKLSMIADLNTVRGKPRQAIAMLAEALQIRPDNLNVRGKLIDLLIMHGEVDEAIGHYIELADGYYHLAQGERALENLNEALRLAPRGEPENDRSAQIYRRLADIHRQRLDWKRAAAALEQVRLVDPADEEASAELADTYFRMAEEEQALRVLEETADRLLERGGATAMLDYLQQQVDRRPDQIEVRRLLGEMQATVGDVEGAAGSWESVIELLVRRGDRNQAAALLRRAIGLHSRQENRFRAMLTHLTKS